MFPNFDTSLFDTSDFKEDSVREVIILPILNRLGYHPIGERTVVRSKSLVHPFIYAGTRKIPVRMIPDYTLFEGGKAVLVLDAKAPNEDITCIANTQQAYSYAVHPEVRVDHFALCNGRRLVLYSVDSSVPLLDISFGEIVSKWQDLEKYLLPKYLLEPQLREMRPDFGSALIRLGLREGGELVMIGAPFGMVCKVSETLMTATVDIEHNERMHCVSFDFDPTMLPKIVSCLPPQLALQFQRALSRQPYQAGADLAIECDLVTRIGAAEEVEHESFVPLIVTEIKNSRFVPSAEPLPERGIPPDIFRLSKAYRVVKAEKDH